MKKMFFIYITCSLAAAQESSKKTDETPNSEEVIIAAPKVERSKDGLAAVFKNLPGVDGKRHSLDGYSNADVLVLTISCHRCPVAQRYEERLKSFVKKHGAKVAVVAVNVNDQPENALAEMSRYAVAHGFNFPYLYDKSQEIAKYLGAEKTPTFFVFGKDRKLVYRGPMDDNQFAKLAKHHYVRQAVEAALRGERPKFAEIDAFGCRIAWSSSN